MGKSVLFLFLAAASVTDLKYRYIDNFQNLFYFILGLLLTAMERGVNGVADGLLTALICFLVLYTFYAGGFIGAGDVKFIMAVSVYTGHRDLTDAVIPITAAGVMMLIVMQNRGSAAGNNDMHSGAAGDTGIKIPMAVPISIGVIWQYLKP